MPLVPIGFVFIVIIVLDSLAAAAMTFLLAGLAAAAAILWIAAMLGYRTKHAIFADDLCARANALAVARENGCLLGYINRGLSSRLILYSTHRAVKRFAIWGESTKLIIWWSASRDYPVVHAYPDRGYWELGPSETLDFIESNMKSMNSSR